MDKVKLIKILNLTSSDIDGECLNAIRMANKLLKANNLRWEDLISAPVQKKNFSDPFSQGYTDPFTDMIRRQNEAAREKRERERKNAADMDRDQKVRQERQTRVEPDVDVIMDMLC
jgi:hypothetical protein